jgi:hypothetical protein
MGYDVRIERRNQAGERLALTLDEWLRVVNEDPHLRLDGFAEVHSPKGEVIRYENKGLAVWTAHSSKLEVRFDYRNGKIVVTNPDAEVLAKMRSVAAKLGARVRGEEGEL